MAKKNYNKYTIYKNYAVLIITSPKHGVFRIKIDIEDVEKCKEIHWCIRICSGQRYLSYYVTGAKGILLHRYLMNPDKSMVVDHINGDKLDNRKSNMRICTFFENRLNNKVYENNTSGHNGVCWHKKADKWMAYIKFKQKWMNLGYYDDIEEAVEARLNKELELFGEYSCNYV